MKKVGFDTNREIECRFLGGFGAPRLRECDKREDEDDDEEDDDPDDEDVDEPEEREEDCDEREENCDEREGEEGEDEREEEVEEPDEREGEEVGGSEDVAQEGGENAGGGTGRTIEGYAIVFGEESRIMDDFGDAFVEVIDNGAVTMEMLNEQDIKMTMWHDREKLLARSNKGVGSLSYEVDSVGVKYRFEAPKTADGEAALELVRRGDIAGSSFVFRTRSENCSWSKNEQGIYVCHVKKIDEIFEFTLATDPAYLKTTATAREHFSRKKNYREFEEFVNDYKIGI